MTKKFPTIFTIETILGCNLHCPECAIGGNLINRKKGYLRFEEFKIIAEKIKPYVKLLYLHSWGEPMMNPDIYKMIEYASKFTKTNISTNANTLNKESCKKLINSGVKDLIVSIDGMTQEVYEQYRIGGKINKVLENLTYLAEFNNEIDNYVNIKPQYIVFGHNEHEMSLFKEFCDNLKLPTIFKAPYLRSDTKLMLSDKIENRTVYSDFSTYRSAISKCSSPVDDFTMALNGDVISCCYDHNSETVMGNIFEQSVEEIYFGEKFLKFRNDLQHGEIPNFCRTNCLQFFYKGKE